MLQTAILELPLFLFVCYLPVYLFLLFFIISKTDRYNIRLHAVSLLATAKYPWNLVFNLSTFLYGFVGCLVLPVSILAIHGITILNISVAIVLFITGLTTSLVGVFPMNKNVKIHGSVAYLVFLFVIFTGIVFVYYFNENDFFSVLMKIVTFLIIGLTTFMAFDKFHSKMENSLLEWIAFISTIAWIFLLSASLLIHILMLK